MREPDPVDWSKYQDGGSGKPLPPDGEYLLEVVDISVKNEDGTLRTSREGYFQPQYDVKVIAPGTPHDGYLSKFNKANTKKWARREGSPLGDYLRGFGIAGPFTTNEQYAAACLQTKGRRLTASLQWQAYNSGNGVNLKGMENFPIEDGKRLTRIVKGSDTVFANAKVQFVKSALKK